MLTITSGPSCPSCTPAAGAKPSACALFNAPDFDARSCPALVAAAFVVKFLRTQVIVVLVRTVSRNPLPAFRCPGFPDNPYHDSTHRTSLTVITMYIHHQCSLQRQGRFSLATGYYVHSTCGPWISPTPVLSLSPRSSLSSRGPGIFWCPSPSPLPWCRWHPLGWPRLWLSLFAQHCVAHPWVSPGPRPSPWHPMPSQPLELASSSPPCPVSPMPMVLVERECGHEHEPGMSGTPYRLYKTTYMALCRILICTLPINPTRSER